MQAKDVMTSQVVTVRSDMTVAEVAGVLMEHHISAVPVVDGDELVGIVSEGDLVRRAEIGTAERHRSWWLQLFTAESALTREYIQSHAIRVRDVMQERVITAVEDTPLHEVAGLLESNRIKRVPVVRNGRLVGIVSRADIVQKLASHRRPAMESVPDDSALRARIEEEIDAHVWRNPIAFTITVTDGVVDLFGMYRTEEERDAARVAAESVEGVKEVHDHRKEVSMYYTH